MAFFQWVHFFLVTYWNSTIPLAVNLVLLPAVEMEMVLYQILIPAAIWRAGYAPSDFTLVELDDPVSATANAFYAGWNTEDIAPSDTVITIHHPSGDEKRISFELDNTYIGNFTGGGGTPTPNPNGTHIIIPDWDIGTTEGGSSGSPLFNNQKQVVGQLHGGLASCTNNSYDAFGRFALSWNGGGTMTTSLKPWLDPDNTGITSLNGRSAMQCNFFVDGTPAVIELCTPAEAVYVITVSSSFQSDVDLTISNLPAGLSASFTTNPVAPGGNTTLTISNTNALSSGNYSFTVTGSDGTDSNSSNLNLNVSNGTPPALGLTTPTDGAIDLGLLPTLTWATNANTSYSIEIATDADFTNTILSASGLFENFYKITSALVSMQQYFWRVRGTNICGDGDWSAVRSFTTAAIDCTPGIATDVPITISESGAPIVTSKIEIAKVGLISDVNVNNIEIDHTWVSDLRLELTSPSGTTIELMNNVFSGDCEEDNLVLSFDDQSSNPYALLDGMCNTTPPALSGDFQPSMPLSAFIGEESMGTWTLTVFDDANQDGGSLINWALDICTTKDFSVTPASSEVANCVGESVSFPITLGAGFDSLVTLSASNLPMGAMATFDPNPAQPGDQITVVLSGAGVGIYDIGIVANAGPETGSTQIAWLVNGAPNVPTAIFPAPNADDISLNPTFSWSNEGTEEYQLEYSADPNFGGIIFNVITSSTSFSVSGLTPCTTYYWHVSARRGLWYSDFTEVFSFTTEDDLSFSTNQPNITICNFGNTSIPIVVGPCFEAGGLTLSTNGLPAGVTATFSSNPVFSNETVDLQIMLNNVAAGSHTFTVEGTDGVNNVSISLNLQVMAGAALTNLVQPANAATNILLEPILSWEAVPGATSYKLQLATDVDFTNIVYNVTQAQTSVDLPIMLEHLTTYFWRVTSSNNCGESITSPFSFTTEPPNAVVDLNGLQLEILPNPTNGILFIKSTAPLNDRIDLAVFSINGILLLEQTMGQGTALTSLDLTGFPSGVYLVRLASGQSVKTERVIVE
ncbi:MAG: proprotein convertase P-domain-containing protein [Saprospiraceae bacterium]